MYFFYIDESGSRDPTPRKTTTKNSKENREHIYALTAVSLFERKWVPFDHEISDHKLRLRSQLYREKNVELESLACCEVKSTSLRLKKSPSEKGYSPFIHNLDDEQKTALSELYYSQLEKHKMRLFSVVMDKRKLHSHMDHETMHKKAYELLLERIEHFLWEFHNSHNGVIVMDDTQRQLNHAVAMKHGWFQREGNKTLRFKHIIEFPFFTDSKLSNGVQLADLCGYNVYRAFRDENFQYPFFEKMLPFFYRSRKTRDGKLDGLKVFPNESELIDFGQAGFQTYLDFGIKKPADEAG